MTFSAIVCTSVWAASVASMHMMYIITHAAAEKFLLLVSFVVEASRVASFAHRHLNVMQILALAKYY